jgi:hypothetical protein
MVTKKDIIPIIRKEKLIPNSKFLLKVRPIDKNPVIPILDRKLIR